MPDPAQVLCLIGPTATGKTDLAIELVQKGPFEIISVDSAMIYRGMDIGTAKPSPEQLAIAPHHLINLCDPSEVYSVAQFTGDANRAIESILKKGKIPLLVGGTMMYFHALQTGISDLPSSDPAIRDKILKEAELLGWPKLHETLREIDPKTAERVHENDSQRIQRALEIYEISKKPLSAWQAENKPEASAYRMLSLGLEMADRCLLHERIAKRFQLMMQAGFLEEARRLFERGDLHLDLPAIRCVGYRQAWQYFLGQWGLETMQEKAVIATRQLAKRQVTWLRHWKTSLQVFDALDDKRLDKILYYLTTQKYL